MDKKEDQRTAEQKKGQNGACDVVVIETKEGPVTINAHDFDPAKHKLAKSQETGAAPVAAEVEEVQKAPAKMTKDELVDYLESKGVKGASMSMTKADLLEMVPAE